jgi:hypothetical protein
MRARFRVLLALLHVAARIQQVESQRCEKNNHFVPVFMGIWGCQECGHGYHSPAGYACEPCPETTVVSNGKWDKSISDWCEPDCFKAWKDFLHMGTRSKAWHIASFANIPCVRSLISYSPSGNVEQDYWQRNKLFQLCNEGKKDCADLGSRCKVEDDSWAQNSVVTMAEKWERGKLFGNSYRECKLCEKGSYKDPNSKLCVSCPRGFVGALPSEDTSDFIPPDVRLATKKISTTTFPPGNYVLFGCRACSDFQGVPTAGACQICKPGQYQRASLETVKHTSGAQFSVVVGVECKVCSPGYEFWNRVENSRSIQCRSFNSQDCCRPCGENQYSSQGEQCQAVASDHVGYNVTSNEVVAIGASAQKQCKQGEELVYCKEGQCSTLQSKTKSGWRTCKPCQLSGTKRFLENRECEECSTQKKDLPNKDNVCESCTLCDKLEVSSAVYILHEIPDAIQTVYDFLPKFDSDGMYVTEKVTAKCVELGRRRVFVNNNQVTFQGVDQYRKDLEDPEVYAVSKFEAISRLGSSCSKVLCSELCFRLNPFHYTPSCGTTTTDQKEIWVHNGSKTLALADVESEAKKENGMYVSNGPCTLCTLCQQGWYNYGCNVYSDGVPHPRGECRECMSKCNDIDTFMYHPDGDGKCHVPPFILRHPSGKWKVEQNYVCKKCPTWVLEKHPNGKMTMSVATACGLRLSFTAYDFENGNVVTKTHAILEWNEREEDEQKFGRVNWLNYRGFMRDLIPYCPRMYFYDDKEQNCDENSLRLYGHESYDVPGTNRKVTYGFSPYNPKCCKLCKAFDPLRSKRREDWEVCPGNTTVDVQNANVDKCGRGYYEHANTSQCRKCSTCHEGMIQP